MNSSRCAKVTVATVVFNAAASIEKTIRSVLCQERDLDYIIVDGGSTDGTLDIVQTYDADLKDWVSEPDQGIYDAMNKAWAMADEDSWVLFLGAGDELLSLPKLLPDAAQEKKALFGNVHLAGRKIFRGRDGLWLKLYNSLHHQALLVPKSLHPAPPFDLSFTAYADFDFNQRLEKRGVKFEYSADLSAYAAPGGVTEKTRLAELHRIILKNYGVFWAAASSCGFQMAALVPALRRLRPIQKD